jgi:acyl carrier protein
MGAPSKAEILQEIQGMMKELFELEPEQIQPETRLVEDLDFDSLDAIDLAVRVEETTGTGMDENVLKELRTVQDIVVAVEAILIKQGLSSLRPAATDV